MNDVAAIVLAAGLSRRMGDINKLLQPVDGDMLLRRVVNACAGVSDHPVTVVTGHEHEAIQRALINDGVNFVRNDDFEQGQMTSVDAGLRNAPSAANYLLALGDQPYLSVSRLAALVLAHASNGGGKITIPFVDGQRGNPIVIPGILRTKMLADPINLGCRKLTRNSPELVHQFVTSDEGFIFDVDTPDDLMRARAAERKREFND